ncbi:MAG: ATP-dependent chaperone ClpB [Micavibrio sp.]|nr:ATP-dependent chaperone ClpB [Micavibrio sp.]
MSNTPDADKKTKKDILIRGSELLATKPNFKLEGRDQELVDLQTIQMRKDANGVILTGASGVGMTALCMGLQASKEDLKTPLDIVNTRYFWLDTDTLFESGDSSKIHEEFQKIRNKLSEDTETVLIIENAGNFIDAARNNGCSSIINALLGDIKNARYQCILETPYPDLAKIMKCDSDMMAQFTMMDVKEPKGDALRAILKTAAPSYEKHHGIRVSQDALDTAAMLSEKYKIKELPAQPAGALSLIDRALAHFRIKAHSEPLHVLSLETELVTTEAALVHERGVSSSDGLKIAELESRQAVLKAQITEGRADWDALQIEVRRISKQKKAEEAEVSKLEERIQAEKDSDRDVAQQSKPAGKSAIADLDGFDEVESEKTVMLQELLNKRREAAKQSANRFQQLTDKINNSLELTSSHVLNMFSRISGIAANKLTQDERLKLLNLDKALGERVYGQDHVIAPMCDAIRTAKKGYTKRDKPQASFLCQGPSGVGKSEMAKALSGIMFDDESTMLVLDMSEYMQEHNVSRLVGAPPGYAGFEEGGFLTNAMEKNPNRVILVDEIEKAHPKVFDVFLQILDSARVTSGQGIVSDFSNTIIIMTSNIGSEFFLDTSLTFEEAAQKAKDALAEHFRIEFLNRFDGQENIYGFKRLELPSLNKIAKREITNLNNILSGESIRVSITDDDLYAMCADKYTPKYGARHIPGFIKKSITSQVSKFTLTYPDVKGDLKMNYDPVTKLITMTPPSDAPKGIVIAQGSNDIKQALQQAAAPTLR